MLERWGLERFVYNIEPIGDDGFFFYHRSHQKRIGSFYEKSICIKKGLYGCVGQIQTGGGYTPTLHLRT